MKDSRDENERQQTYIHVCVYMYTYVQAEKGNVFVLAQLASIAQANFFLVRLLVREFFCLLSLLFLMATDQDFFDREE